MSASEKDTTLRRHVIISVVITLVATAGFYKASSIYILSQAEKNIQNLLLSHKGIHHYVQRVMLPALIKYRKEGKLSESFYAPELFSSSYIVRNQHQFYNEERELAGFSKLYYKLAAKNPRNPVNKADALEEGLIERFNQDRSLTKVRKIVDIDGQKFLYLALPFLTNEKFCMRCHGARQDAPLELQTRYPGEGGFNEKVGDIRAITSIRAPLHEENHLLTVILAAVALGACSFLYLVIFNKRLANKVADSTHLLRENEKYLKAIQESMQVGLLLIDAKTRTVVDVNQVALDVIKLPRQEVLGRQCFSCLCPAGENQCPILDNGQTVDQSERTLIDGQGQKIPIMKTATTIDINGKSYVIETFIDISERKKEQEHLAENEKKLRTFLESTSSVPWELDLASGRFTYIGAQIEKILGYPVDSWLDISSWRARLHPDDQEWAFAYCTSHTAKGEDHDFTYRAVHADGSYRWIRDVVSVISGSDGPVKLLGFMQDVSAQKKIEQEKASLESRLNQAQKMEAIGTLAGGIAHDFNNILSVILGYAGMAKEDAPPESSLSQDLERILGAGERAKDLVRQILAFSRHSQIERMTLSPQPILKESLKMLRASIPTTITIVDNIRPNCGCLDADPTQLHQILMNLCTNAYHAMEENGGTMTIELKTAERLPADFTVPQGLTSTDFLELTVSDTGCGIPPAVIDKIFEPYFTTKEVGKGTGMGLSITYGIVHDYGGTIYVESELGRGTAFHLYFPKSSSEATHVAVAQEAVPLGKERILLVDDEEFLCEMGREMLQKLGYAVSAHHSSLAALDEFLQDPAKFDLVITDQTMPDITGLELARRILELRPETPIILCTGYASRVTEELAKAHGIREFVLKPISKDMITRLIRKVLADPDKNADAC